MTEMFDPAHLPPPLRRPQSRWMLLAALGVMSALACSADWISGEYDRGQIMRGKLGRSYDRRFVVSDMMSRLKDAETGQRGYLLTDDPAFLTPYRSAIAAIDDRRGQMEHLLVNVPMQEARYARLCHLIQLRIDDLRNVLDMRATKGRESARRRVADRHGLVMMDQARAVAGAMTMEEDRMIAAMLLSGRERAVVAPRTIWVLVGLACALILFSLALALYWQRSRYRLALQMQGAAARLSAVFAGTSDAIALLNPDGTIQAINPAVTRMLGHPSSALVGRDLSVLVDVLPPTGDLRQRIGLRADGIDEPLRIDRIAHHVDGHSVSVDVALGLMPMPDGLHVVAAIHDISGRKAIERLKDEFIATVSHELRTPLTSIVGALGLLRATSGATLPDAAHRLVSVAEENSRRLIDLVNDLLDIEKMDAGGFRFRSLPTDLVPLLERAAQSGEGLAASRSVKISVVVSASHLPLQGDEGRLTQVVTNLLANAIRFSPDGGVVVLTAERRGGWALVTVDDDGPGVPATFRDQLFTRFAQSEDGRSAGGSGLGLAISRQIIRGQGGKIWYEPRPGGGARFRFTIRLQSAAETPPAASAAPAVSS